MLLSTAAATRLQRQAAAPPTPSHPSPSLWAQASVRRSSLNQPARPSSTLQTCTCTHLLRAIQMASPMGSWRCSTARPALRICGRAGGRAGHRSRGAGHSLLPPASPSVRAGQAAAAAAARSPRVSHQPTNPNPQCRRTVLMWASCAEMLPWPWARWYCSRLSTSRSTYSDNGSRGCGERSGAAAAHGRQPPHPRQPAAGARRPSTSQHAQHDSKQPRGTHLVFFTKPPARGQRR